MSTTIVTPAKLLDEFGAREMIALTDVGTPRTGAVDTAVAQRACDRAEAEVLAAVSVRYAVPLASVPLLVEAVAKDLAHYYLYHSEPPVWVSTRFDQARATLRDIRTGALNLGLDAAGVQLDSTPTDLPVMDGGQRVFGRDSL